MSRNIADSPTVLESWQRHVSFHFFRNFSGFHLVPSSFFFPSQTLQDFSTGLTRFFISLTEYILYCNVLGQHTTDNHPANFQNHFLFSRDVLIYSAKLVDTEKSPDTDATCFLTTPRFLLFMCHHLLPAFFLGSG